MSILPGISRAVNTTGTLYGVYSFGNRYEQLLSEAGLAENLGHIKEDMQMAGVLDQLPEMCCMDVGTGRQSISLARLGAKCVTHFDISEEHVSRFNTLLKHTYPDLPIVSRQKNLCKESLPRNQFDFVYLNGIVHHFSEVDIGLQNCAESVKNGGLIWVYFYRSGTFKWFVMEMVRQLISSSDLDEFFTASALTLSNGDHKSPQVSQLMDDFFAPYIHLYPPSDYIAFMRGLGFSLVSSRDVDPISDVNHERAHHSCSLVFKKTNMIEIAGSDQSGLLSPESDVCQLNKCLYTNPVVHEIIDLFVELKAKKEKLSNLARFGCVLALHRCAGPQYYGEVELPPRYNEVRAILTNTLK